MAAFQAPTQAPGFLPMPFRCGSAGVCGSAAVPGPFRGRRDTATPCVILAGAVWLRSPLTGESSALPALGANWAVAVQFAELRPSAR